MTEYALYLESGPQRKKTMVHVLELLGCVATGLTTETAIEATPAAIETYLHFLRRCSEEAPLRESITTRTAEHITQGAWLGNGSPYLMFAPDFEAVTLDEVERFTHRFEVMRDELARWAGGLTEEQLEASPTTERGRTNRAILLHVMDNPASYISAIFGGVKGASRIHTLCERGEMPIAEGLRQVCRLVSRTLRGATPDQRSAIIERGEIMRSLRKAIRRTLEHDWEHLLELSRRPGGPDLGP
jgi:predicted RNase H-like HicB family nuclease/uncharacterized damage-inducible protein DinB